METPARVKFEGKMADSRFAISNQSDVEQQKKILKTKILESNNGPGWKFGRTGRQNGKLRLVQFW